MSRAPYVLYGGKYIDLVSLAPFFVSGLWVSVSFAPTEEYGLQKFLPPTLNRSSPVGGWLTRRWALASALSTSSHDLPDFAAVAGSSAARWEAYWLAGGMVDLAPAFGVDSRWASFACFWCPFEGVERQVVLIYCPVCRWSRAGGGQWQSTL